MQLNSMTSAWIDLMSYNIADRPCLSLSYCNGFMCSLSFRQTQWDPPSWDGTTEEASVEHEAEMDLGTPTYDENPSKVLNSSSCFKRINLGIFINLELEIR